MKNSDPDRNPWLNELLESERGDCGPSAEQVSRLVRGVHARRIQRSVVVMATAVSAIFAMLITVHQRTPTAPTVADIPGVPTPIVSAADHASARESFPVEIIDDRRLLEMLQDQPVALASLPNGERRLMMIVPRSRLTAANHWR